jgi:P4 family phage/plasmid primase-like protien
MKKVVLGGNGKRKVIESPNHIPRHPKRTKLETLVSDTAKKIGEVKVVDDRWFWYKVGVWKEVNKSRFKPIALAVQDEEIRTPKTTNLILEWIEQKNQIDITQFCGVVKWEGEPWKVLLINCSNWVVRIDLTKRKDNISTLAHSPEFMFTGQLPCHYDEVSNCPVYIKALDAALPEREDRELLRLWFAHCLVPDSKKFQSALVCHGRPESGKSTLVYHALGAVFGDFKSDVSLRQICSDDGDDKIAYLADSLVNIASELDYRTMDDSTRFNQLISGEAMIIRPRFKEGRKLETTSKFCFLANHLPNFKRGSEAQARRIRIIHFANSFRGKTDKDSQIQDKLVKERDGIFKWLVQKVSELSGYHEMPQGSQLSQKSFELFAENNNPIGTFVEQHCIMRDDLWIAREEFRQAFDRFADSRSIKVSEKTDVCQLLYQNYSEIKRDKFAKKQIGRRRFYIIKGIDLTEESRKEFMGSRVRTG